MNIKRAISSLADTASNFCPKCGEELHCPCEHCNNEGMVKWIWTEDGNGCKCPKCGFIAHVDWWESWTMDAFSHQLRARTKKAWAILTSPNRIIQ